MSRTEAREILTALSMDAEIKSALAVAAVVFHWTFGADLTPLLVMVALMVLDAVTGIWLAAVKRDLCPEGFGMIFRKLVGYSLMLAGMSILDKVMPRPWAFMLTSAFLAGHEALSLLRNLSLLGFPVPTVLMSRLKALQQSRDSTSKAPATGV